MTPFSFSQLSDREVLSELGLQLTRERAATLVVLALVGEAEKRGLYRPAGYPSMFTYCVHELHMSEDVALTRIRAARAVRRFPALFPALAEGRVHLSAVVLLWPNLTRDNFDELLAAATHKTRAEVRLLVAERFPQADVPTVVQAIGAPVASHVQVVPSAAMSTLPLTPEQPVPSIEPVASPQLEPLVSKPVVPSNESKTATCVVPVAPYTKVAPLSPGRFAIQVTVDQETHELLRYAQALHGHSLPSGDVAEVLKRALRDHVQKLEKRKFAKSARSRGGSGEHPSTNSRYVPAETRCAVWHRDGGKCTFVSSTGTRCGSETRLELDHIVPVARGGATTTENLRLLCKTHNQLAAEREFGADFMSGKRQQARARAMGQNHAASQP